MDKIPTIGGARGIFEIFVPGLFLLLNFAGGVYLVPFTDDVTRRQLAAIASNPPLALFVAVPFGYLSGVVLWLFRAEVSDRASARFIQIYDRNARGGERQGNSYAYARFPYTRWIETVINRRLAPDVRDFFASVWAGRDSRQFLNFCKVVVSAEDPAAGAEIYGAESLSR